ncbi:MAG: YraN family protein [Coriobacteriia bacterium]
MARETTGRRDAHNKTLGARGEQAAAEYLERQGLTVVERNWRCALGEIDLIAIEGKTLVFCEVKTRASTSAGTPLEAVDAAKTRKLLALVKAYLWRNRLEDLPCRVDVLGVTVHGGKATVRHIRNALGDLG